MTRTTYVTTPIYYVNDRPHIGHMYTTTVADVVARYRRLLGDDVRFLTGTDEHGQKMERSAAVRGATPIQLADEVVRNYLDLYPRLQITNDDFIRTTQPRHHEAVARLFGMMQKRGDIVLGRYEGWYCTGDEAFIPENQVKNGRCENGHPVERMTEESYFFKLSAYQQPLLDLYRRREAEGRPLVQPKTRMNEVRAFVEGGLNDLSISRRSVRWGIPVPADPSHVVYVWLDALTNYISALGFGGADHALYDRYWRDAPDASVVQLVGKEIIRFHAVYWPAFLLSAGLPVPMTVYGHGWWLFDNEKMSKSIGNVVRPGPLLDVVGPDALRYFLMREMSFGQDGSYANAALIERLNGDLANGLGNLVSRVLTLLVKDAGGRIPAPGSGTPATDALGTAAKAAYTAYRNAFDRFAFAEGIAAVFEFVAELNRFLVREEPWKVAKDPARAKDLQAILRASAEGVRSVALWLFPVMPGAMARVLDDLGLALPAIGDLASWQWDAIPAHSPVRLASALFPRTDKDAAIARIEALSLEAAAMTDAPPSNPPPSEPAGSAAAGTAAPGDASVPAPAPPLLDIDQFLSVQLRTAKVVTAERVPKADKLLRLVVDLGGETRQIVAGIAATYTPEELVGRTIVVVANLKPAKLRGVESQGMLLAADAGAGPIILTLDKEVPPGTRVR